MPKVVKGYKPELRVTANLWRRILYTRIVDTIVYEGLPEEINEQVLKLFLFKYGKLAFYKKRNGEFTIQPFEYQKILDEYYLPTAGLITNPYLPKGEQTHSFLLKDEPVLYNSTVDMYNYSRNSVVSDFIYKTALQLAESDISYYCLQRNHRLILIITAEDDKQKDEANAVLDKMLNGEANMVMSEDLVSHITVNPVSSASSSRAVLSEIVEFSQYILGNFYHAFGLNSNYNLKRENLTSNEIDVNEDVLSLNIYDLLQARKKSLDLINKRWGLNITCKLNPDIYKESQNETSKEESQNETNEEESQNETSEEE